MGAYPCERCGGQRPFRLVVSYDCFRFFSAFGCVTRRRYIAACTLCGQGTPVPRQQLPELPDFDPIPFMERWGVTILAASIAALCAVSAWLWKIVESPV
jgi:hypothetical protein